MLTKILVSCALLVAAQARYAPSKYGNNKPVVGGYAAQLQPAVTVTVLPYKYGAGPAYGPAYGPSQNYGASYAPSQGYGSSQGYGAGPITIPYYTNSNPINAYNAGVDADALNLASLVFALPSPGAPNAEKINIPQIPVTYYTQPAVSVVPGGKYASPINGASAAAAAANVADTYPAAPAPAPSKVY